MKHSLLLVMLLIVLGLSTEGLAQNNPYGQNPGDYNQGQQSSGNPSDSNTQQQNSSTTTSDAPQDVQHAPSVVLVPSSEAWQRTEQLFTDSEFDKFNKQKKVNLFQIPTLKNN